MATQVFEFGLLQPQSGVDAVMTQLALGQRYYNNILDARRQRALDYLKLRSELGGSSLADLEAKLRKKNEEISAAEKDLRSLKGKRDRPSSDRRKVLKEDIRKLKDERKLLVEPLREAKKAVGSDARLKERVSVLNDQEKARTKALRKACGLTPGSYLHVEDRVRAAFNSVKKPKEKSKGSGPKRRDPKPDGDGLKLPKFRAFRGEGTLAIQFQQPHEKPCQILRENLLAAYDAACEESPVKPVFVEPPCICADPAVTLIGDLMGERNRQIQIVPRDVTGSKCKKPKARHILRFRVGSTGKKRDPVWAEWPMVMHRDIPEDASIKWVKIHRVRQGSWFRWVVQFTVKVSDPAPQPASSIVGVDLGWRSMGKAGPVLAGTFGDQKSLGEIKIPASVRQAFDRVKAIRGIRDKYLDKLRTDISNALTPALLASMPDERDRRSLLHIDKWKSPKKFVRLMRQTRDQQGAEHIHALLTAWYYGDRREPSTADIWARDLDKLRKDISESLSPEILAALPPSVREGVTQVSHWKSARRFTRLLRQVENLPGAEPLYHLLRDWYSYRTAQDVEFHGDKHLWQYESGLRRKAIAHRREIYRIHAAKLARQYDFLAVEDCFLPELIDEKPIENQKEKSNREAEIDNKRDYHRYIVAPGSLRNILVNAFAREGKRYYFVEAKGTSSTCHVCNKSGPKIGPAKMQTCRFCGAVWDRDLNAVHNIVERARTALAKDAHLGVPKKRRPAKRKKLASASVATVTPSPLASV